MIFDCIEYAPDCDRIDIKKNVIVFKITSPNQVLSKNNNPVINALEECHLDNSVGIYFYRFLDLEKYKSFSKIGEVTRKEGLKERFSRGWHGTPKYSDTYLNKNIHTDIMDISETNPMYFTFYEFDLFNAYPKIDEQIAFKNHYDHFAKSTRNKEKPNSNFDIGKNLVFHKNAFAEVLSLKFPGGKNYPR